MTCGNSKMNIMSCRLRGPLSAKSSRKVQVQPLCLEWSTEHESLFDIDKHVKENTNCERMKCIAMEIEVSFLSS